MYTRVPPSFLDRFCSPEDSPARAVASHALSVIFPDIESEREFTHARRALSPIWDEIQLQSLGAPGAVLDLQVRPQGDASELGPTNDKERGREELLVTLERISRTGLVPEAEGFEARSYIAKLWVEILAMYPDDGVPPGVRELGMAFRQILKELHQGKTRRGAFEPPSSLLELKGMLDREPQDSSRFPGYFWSAWRAHLSGYAYQAIVHPVPLGESLDEDPDADVGVVIPGEPGVDPAIPAGRPFGWLPANTEEPEPLRNHPGAREGFVRSGLSTITPLHALTDASTTVLDDSAMSAEVGRLLRLAASALQNKEVELAEKLIARCMLPATATLATQVSQLKWGEAEDAVAQPGCLSLDAEWLFRPELRPDNPDVGPIERGGSVVWLPIPAALRDLVKRMNPAPVLGECVFPALGRMALDLSDDAPSTTMLRRSILNRLAASEPLGLTAAQWAAGDSLGISLTPLHYDRFDADRFAQLVERSVFPWFGEKPGRPRKRRPGIHVLGSRVCPRLSDVIGVMSAVRSGGLVVQDELIGRLLRRTNNLVHGLAVLSGHRPTEGFSLLTINHFALTDPVAVIEDKVAGPDWQVRPIVLPRVWQQELLRLVAELREAVARFPGTALSKEAAAALDGTGPLFIVATTADQVRPFLLRDYMEVLPTELRSSPNFARHMLNAYLIGRVPEAVRVAQLGWHGTREGAWADGSPWSVIDIAAILEAPLSEHLKNLGWRPLPGSYQASGVPNVQIDWIKAERAHQQSFNRHVIRLKLAAAARHAEIATPMREVIREYLARNIPGLTLEPHGGFRRTDGVADTPIEIGDDHLATLEQALAGGVAKSVQGAVARNLLSALMRDGRKRKVVLGRVPRRVVWHFPSRPGHFTSVQPAAMRASRQLDAWLVEAGPRLSEAAIAAVSLILHGGYAQVDTVMAVLSPTATLRRIRSHQDVVLVGVGDHEAGQGQARSFAFHGLAALHLRRWRSCGECALPSVDELDRELHALVPANLRPEQASGTLNHLAALARARRALVMDGMARLIGLGEVLPSTVSLDRVVAAHDGLGVHHEDVRPRATAPPRNDMPATRKAGGLASLYELITSAVQGGQNPRVGEAKARKVLEDELLEWCSQESTAIRMVDLLARYALALVQRGGDRRKVLELRTIRGYLYEVAVPLITHLPNRPLEASVGAWNSAILTIIASSAPSIRGARFLGLRRFHLVLNQEFQMPDVDFGEFIDIAGPRHHAVDAGFITDAEFAAAYSCLAAEAAILRVGHAAPHDIHLAEARCVALPMMRASGLRTGEVHGLSYRDMHTDEPCGRMIVRGSSYQNLKTAKARRGSCLRGAHHDLAIRMAREWEGAAKEREGSGYRRSSPVFSDLGASPGRLDRNDLFGRIGELLKWATGLPAAKPYWLRKSAARERLIELMGSAPTSLWPLRALLGEMGHGSVRVTLGHYIHDPLPPFLGWFDTCHGELDASRIAFAVGLSKSRVSRDLDQKRSVPARGRSRARIAQLLAPVRFCSDGAGVVHLPDPPRVASVFHPLPAEIDVVMRRVAGGDTLASATALHRWPAATTAALDAAIQALQDPYQVGFTEGSASLRITPPRSLSRANQVLGVLDDLAAMPVLAEMGERWIAFAATGFPQGFVGTASDWGHWIKGIPLLAEGRWEECRRGAYQVRAPSRGVEGTGTWRAWLWVAMVAWLWRALRPGATP